MPCHGTRKCSNCKLFFKPNPRAQERQNFCSHPECRKASKWISQKKWLDKPENRDYFRGSDNVQRVQIWREKNPGYWKRTKTKNNPEIVQQSLHSERPLQETLITQLIEKQKEYSDLKGYALQEPLISQDAVFIGLIAHLTGTALQDLIVRHGQEMRESGEYFLYQSQLNKGNCDVISSITQSTETAPNPPSIQLDRPPPGS